MAVAAGRRTIIDRIRPLAARLDRVSGWIMVSSGGFIVWYRATVLVAGSSALGRMPIVGAIDEWSSAATRFICERPLAIGAAVVVVVAMERVLARTARR